jgi:hypothetical protein
MLPMPKSTQIAARLPVLLLLCVCRPAAAQMPSALTFIRKVQ